jgi:sugar lactone lactonase YvrE
MKRIISLLIVLYTCAVSTSAQIVTTIVGNGTHGFSGDGGSSTIAQLYGPHSIAFDDTGNIYIADAGNHRIRKINTAGKISTIAGNGTIGNAGNGGPAISAQLNFPVGVTVDHSGNVYIADHFNNAIRKVSVSGILTTVAGTGMSGYSGDGGLAVAAELQNPFDVTIDNTGNIFIADAMNNRIRKVNSSGLITTIAGNGSIGYTGDGVAATTVALNRPNKVITDNFGNVYISDCFNHRVRKVSPSGIITTIAGNGTSGFGGDGGDATAAQLNQPSGLAIDNAGNIYIADAYNNRIRKVAVNGLISTVAGTGISGYSGDGGAATSAQFNVPNDVAISSTNTLYISDWNNNVIRRMDATASVEGGNIDNAVSIFPNPCHDRKLKVAFPTLHVQNATIKIYDLNGGLLSSFDTNGQTSIGIEFPYSEGVYLFILQLDDLTVRKVVIAQ